ncbi:MAG: hypothetical protein HC765_11225 [Brachymonas sp.]|nr:hypothetical protein [Brachymonas sp.]
MSAKSEQLAKLIQDWLRQQNADYNSWSEADFDCMKNCPEMLVALDAVGYLEWRNTDGGLVQVFAETSAHWHRFLDLCEIGYRQIGAMQHANRIGEVRVFFKSIEPEFLVAVEADMRAYENGDEGFEHVRKFKNDDWVNTRERDLQSQYYYSDEVINLRDQRLVTNESEIRLAMVRCDLKRAAEQLQHISSATKQLTQLRSLMASLDNPSQ